jgi:hypothetical protein
MVALSARKGIAIVAEAVDERTQWSNILQLVVLPDLQVRSGAAKKPFC